MTEQEVEEKYNALASALKLDKHTLKRRIELMKHQRDQSERSIEKELTAIQHCLKTLESQCKSNPTSTECLDKLQKQADALRKMSVWLAGRAEGLGAVQEEGRLSDAAEIMVCHVDNLRRLFEREHAELEEARKLLQENRAFLRGNVSPGALTSMDGDQDSRLFNRRAFSITPGSKAGLKRHRSAVDLKELEVTSRRRNSVAVLGFAGAQLASSSTSQSPQGQGVYMRSTSTPPNKFSAVAKSAREGRSRWSLIASKATSASRRQSTSDAATSRPESTDGDESPLPSPVSTSSSLQTSPCPTPKTPDVPLSPSHKSASETAETRTKREEEIYQQGYEQGVRSKVSEELTDLRGQQKTFCENLEGLMENAAEEEEQDEKEQQEQERNVQNQLLPWTIFHDARQRKYLRLGFAIFLFLFVLLNIVLQNLPVHICKPGLPVSNSALYKVCEVLRPFVRLTYESPPPI
ncbi:uncharacterized protein [Amphiura filiformis]|uniref:uncharacterized protein n=1 Tax=Amphiura filiformis TaxID=82378 RepID=UPI003B228BE1